MAGAVVIQEDLASMSIEQIEAEALKQLEGEASPGDGTGTADPDSASLGDPMLDAEIAKAKQDVDQASSGQAAAEVPANKKSDKELNFAALRVKQQKTEEDLRAAQEELKRLSQRGTFDAVLPEDHAQRMDAVKAEINDIGTRFQNGDITWEQHQQLLNDASVKREALLEEAMLAKISQQMKEQEAKENAEASKKTWDQTVKSFISGKPDGIDYESDDVKSRDLNVYVKALAADPDNADKDFNWFINTAHGLVKSKHNVAASSEAAGKPEKQPEKLEAPAKNMPFHTLGDLPGGSVAARNEVEQIADISGAALANKFMNDPGSIDKYLASLG